MPRIVVVIGSAVVTLGMASRALAENAKTLPLPTKIDLPLTPDSFCAGVKYLPESARSNLTEELAVICAGESATQVFRTLVASPYSGQGDVNYREIFTGNAPNDNGYIQLKVVYSMRVQKSPVSLLLSEEGLMTDAYSNAGLSMKTGFLDPPVNNNDSDTSFAISQRAERRQERGRFDDTSRHTLRLYRMHPNNFDFLVAARTMDAPSNQFKKSTVLRASLKDPNDPNYSVSVTVMNILVLDQTNNGDRVEQVFGDYIREDIVHVFKYHQNRP